MMQSCKYIQNVIDIDLTRLPYNTPTALILCRS